MQRLRQTRYTQRYIKGASCHIHAVVQRPSLIMSKWKRIERDVVQTHLRGCARLPTWRNTVLHSSPRSTPPGSQLCTHPQRLPRTHKVNHPYTHTHTHTQCIHTCIHACMPSHCTSLQHDCSPVTGFSQSSTYSHSLEGPGLLSSSTMST